MKLSIIVPVLNEAPRMAVALSALSPLRQRGAEVIVVDGGSNDGTVNVSRPLCDQVTDAPRGRAKQQNAGASVASGEVLAFLHADTTLPDDADQLIANAIQAGSVWGRFDVTFPDVPANAQPFPPMLHVVAFMMNLRSRMTGIATGDQCLFMKREVFERVGRFAEQPLMEDIELSKRLKKISPPACLRAQVTTSPRRWLKHGVWRTVALMWWLRLAYWFGVAPSTLARWYGYR